MAHETHVDTHEVERLAVDLTRAPGRAQRRSRDVIKRAGVEIKKGMRADFLESRNSGGPHGGKFHTYHPRVHRGINFDLFDDGFGVEVGVDKNKHKDEHQGDLASILAFGTARTAPIVDHTASLRRELPNALRHFGDAAEESVLGDRSE